MKPTDAVLAITYNCNARCRMCDIWKIENNNLLEPEYYARLPKSLRNINISGGEPFLNKDIVKIIEVIHKVCPKARIVISSNGYATELILKHFKEIQKIFPHIAIRISIDGLNTFHNYMRGRDDFFERSIETVKKLKELNAGDLGISYTASDDNLDQMLDIYNLANELGIVYTFCGIAHSSDIENYFTDEDKPISKLPQLVEGLNHMINNELQKWQLNSLARACYLSGVYTHAKYGKRKIFCGALDVLFYMDPHGEVLSCNALGKKLFNIKDKPFEEAWLSNEANTIRQIVKNCPRPCWMLCTVSPYLKKKPFYLLKWILVNKMKYLLGFPTMIK